MPVIASDKPLDALREQTIDQLILNYGHAKLSLEAFERRLDRALEAESHEALSALTEDLELVADESVAQKKKQELDIRVDERNAHDVDYMVHVFAGTNKRGAWRVAKEIRMFNIFGGAELDFSEALLSSKTTRIKTLCLFGGANILVPEGMNTISNAICIFGGVDNSGTSSTEPDAPTIILEGLILFGGATVKIKKTIKERLIEFADNVRNMFGQAQ